jgi:hypothetical protein
MRSIGILFLLVCLTVVRAGPVSHDSSAVTNSAAGFHKPSIYIYGQVQKPGPYDWFQGMTVVDAVQAAGGFTSTNHSVEIERIEDGHGIFHHIIFNPDTFPHDMKMPPMLMLNDSDIISVPSVLPMIELPDIAPKPTASPLLVETLSQFHAGDDSRRGSAWGR